MSSSNAHPSNILGTRPSPEYGSSGKENGRKS